MNSLERYIRQIGLATFGMDGQRKLSSSKILVVGLGGLGLPALQYLNAMGVGTLGLVDQDMVSLHNLQRQVVYTEADVGKSKLKATLHKLQQQNSQTTFKTFDTFLTAYNALEIIAQFDLVLDASDNFATRYLINDACVILDKPFVYGALHSFEGQVSVFNYKDGPTYRCLFPDMPKPHEVPNCDENGVLGIIPGIIGSLQALETVKVITEIGEVLSGKLLLFDGLTQSYQKILFPANPKNKSITQLQESYGDLFCDVVPTIAPEEFRKIQETDSNILFIDVRTHKEYQDYHLEDSINIPLNLVETINQEMLEKKHVYLICQSGKRSEIALRLLRKKYPNNSFCHILGGINQMKLVCP